MIRKGEPMMNESLHHNPSVKELLAILDENRVDAGGLLAMLGYVHAMERQLDAAVTELKEIRRELSDMREERSHPLRSALQKAAQTLEVKIAETRSKLDELKETILQGCKNAVSAFKERGISVLSNLASFFRADPILQAMKRSLTEGIVSNEQAMSRIDALSAEYHQAGLHIKNMGRAVRGKETQQFVKPSGRLTKLAKQPFAAYNAQMKQALSNVNKMIAGLERLNKKARQEPEKPSILEKLETMKERARQTGYDSPAQTAAKRRDVSI